VVILGGLATLKKDQQEYLSRVETIDVSSNVQNCSSVMNYPLNLYGPTGVFLNGKIMVCGGCLETGLSNKCFKLKTAQDLWTEMEPLPLTTAYARS